MITTPAEFEDSSAFERSALDSVYPLLGTNPRGSIIELRDLESPHVYATVTENFGEAARAALINELRPLLFGAAWKTLDLLLELALHQAGLSPKMAGRWTIAEKKAHALATHGVLAGLSTDTDIWARICALYANTVEARHCLTHRSFMMSPSGDMTDLHDQNGAAVPDVTSGEQQAFCQVSQRAAGVVLSSRFSSRDRSSLIWWLDQLANHHRLGVLGGGALGQPIPIVLVNAEHTAAGWTVDLARARDGSGMIGGKPYFDIEIYFPDSGLPPVSGYLEEVPSVDKVVIDPARLPPWLRP